MAPSVPHKNIGTVKTFNFLLFLFVEGKQWGYSMDGGKKAGTGWVVTLNLDGLRAVFTWDGVGGRGGGAHKLLRVVPFACVGYDSCFSFERWQEMVAVGSS